MRKRESSRVTNHELELSAGNNEEYSVPAAAHPRFMAQKIDDAKELLEAPFILLLIASIFVSICTNAAAHLCYDTGSRPIDFFEVENYLCFPWLFFWDAVFLFVIIILLSITDGRHARKFTPVSAIEYSKNNGRQRTCCSKGIIGFVTILAILIFFVSVLETKSLIISGECIPWDMTIHMWDNWDEFKILIESKADEGFIKVWMICLFQISLTGIVLKVISIFKTKKTRSLKTSNILRNGRTNLRIKLPIFIGYCFAAWAYRPTVSMERLWLSSMYSIPQKIVYGNDRDILSYYNGDIVQNENEGHAEQHRSTPSKSNTTNLDVPKDLTLSNTVKNFNVPKNSVASNTTTTSSNAKTLNVPKDSAAAVSSTTTTNNVPKNSVASSTATAPRPLNVFLILLETVRADLMPFDSSTPWAEKHIPESKHLTNDITPFYRKWVKDPSTLYIPHIRSASGFTHKSLTSILCSVHALPIKLTQEHKSRLYHECLPSLLQKTGHGYKNHRFFKSLTSWFDMQTELMSNIGFHNANANIEFYGEQEYNNEHHQKDPGPHRANYFGYEDNPFIVEIMEWVDEQLSKSKNPDLREPNNTRSEESFDPFFLSHLTGVTHDPYNTPPKISWQKQNIVNDEKINNLLNGVAYTDVFLSKVIDEFERRDLMKSTLFVIMGDHGANFKNRDDKMTTYEENKEESFDVGVSFRTEHEETAKYLKQIETSGVIQSGTWSTIDVLPTIVELLNLFSDGKTNVTKLLNGNHEESIVDGRSMLHPSGRRILLSIANPGHTVSFRDGSYVLIRHNTNVRKPSEVYDLRKDPFQTKPIYFEGLNALRQVKKEDRDLIHWGQQAVKFVEELKLNLYHAHKHGVRCSNCALSKLNSLESLDQWEKYE